MYELIIIGGGPAGMTAAVYAARKKIDTLLLAREIGGQVTATSGIENYMGYQYIEGNELMDKFEKQLTQFPIKQQIGEEVIRMARVDRGWEVIAKSGASYQSRAVIIATGKNPRRLAVPGEKELTGRGVSYCAVCDGPLFTGENVAVIGGGNSALEAIDDLLKIATRVYSITDLGYTGDAVLVDRIKGHPNLVECHRCQVLEIRGDIRVQTMMIKDGQRGENRTLAVGGVFIEIGLVPNSDPVKGLARLNTQGEIEINCNCETSTQGLLAAGDVTNIPEKQIIIAAGEGAKSALVAHRYIQRAQ